MFAIGCALLAFALGGAQIAAPHVPTTDATLEIGKLPARAGRLLARRSPPTAGSNGASSCHRFRTIALRALPCGMAARRASDGTEVIAA